MSKTLAILKPDALTNPTIFKMIAQVMNNSGLEIIKKQEVRLSRQQAEQLYAVHKGKFFYERLIRHMTSGPTIAMLLCSKSGQDAITEWRRLLGPSKSSKSLLRLDKSGHSLRERFALSDARNVGHGSDSEPELRREIEVFPDLLDEFPHAVGL